MKLFSTALIFIFCQVLSLAQSTDQVEQRWVRMMSEPNANFFDIQREFNEYWLNREHVKGDGWKAFKRWEYNWQHRILPDGTFPNGRELWEALRKKNQDRAAWLRSKSNRAQNPTANFTLMGPSTAIPTGGGCGRVNTVTFHPLNSNILWVGTPAGGLWKSTNNGVGWTSNTDQFTSLGVSAIAIDPSDPNIMYIGTGDRDASDTYGTGVLKSTDGGATWNATGLSAVLQNFFVVNRLLIHPTQTNIILAATTSGIYKSTDAGVSWSQKNTASAKDMIFMPSNPSYIYSTSGGTIRRSTNLGESWSTLSTGFSSSAVNRIALAVCAQNPRCVYALCSNASGSTYYGLYRSLDTGNTWSLRSSTPNILGGNSTGTDTRGQGWYDLCIAVQPNDSNDVFIGGINTWRSTDGGANWICKSMWYTGTSLPYVHADEHDMWYKPGTNELYVANDGGLFRTTNAGTTWTDLSAGLQIMQFYRISQSASNSTKFLGGAQDNGSNFFNAGGWTQVYGGDGMDNAVHQSNDAILFASSQNGNFGRSTNNGASFSTITPSGQGSTGAWVTPLVLDSSNNVYVAYTNVYKSTNNGTAWTTIGSAVLSSVATFMAVARSNPNYVVVGNSSQLFRTTNGGTNWGSIKGSLPSGIVRLAIHPSGPDTMVAVASNWTSGSKVYRTTNGGTSWTNISGSLPNVPAQCAVYENNAASGLYVGTDIGIYYRNNSMSDWISYDDGLPNVRVNDLEIYYPTLKLRAGTYGRGAWQGNLYRPGPLASMSASRTSLCAGDTITLMDNSTNGATSREWRIPGANPSVSTAQNPVIAFAAAGVYSVTLIAMNSFGSDTLVATNYITVNPAPSAAYSYSSLSACDGDSIVLSAAAGLRTYAWSTGENSQKISLRSVGTTNIQLSVTDSNGCAAQSTMQSFSIYTVPAPLLSGDSLVCTASNGTYRLTSTSSGSTFRWLKPRSAVTIGDSTQPQIQYTWPTAGTDTVRVRETNIRGCVAERMIIVRVNDLPSGSIVGSSTSCQNTMATYSTGVLSPGLTIEWQQPRRGSIVGSNSNISGVNIRWTESGVDTVRASIVNTFGCRSTLAFPVSLQAAPTPSISGPILVCESGEATYQCQSTTGSSYLWTVPAMGSIRQDSTSSTVVIRWTKIGRGEIQLTETSADGCTTRVSKEVTVAANPAPVISGPSVPCTGHTVSYSAMFNAGSSYAWHRPTRGSVNGDTTRNVVQITWSNGGADSVVLVETNASGCSQRTLLTVRIENELKPQLQSANGLRELCPGQSLQLHTSRGFTTYTWRRNGEAIAGSSDSLLINEGGNYTVAVQSGSCSGISDTLRIVLLPGAPTPVISRENNTLRCQTPAVKYQWYVDNVVIDGATGSAIQAYKSGNYCVKLVDSSGCVSTLRCMGLVVSIDEQDGAALQYTIHPNPANEYFSITSDHYTDQALDIHLYDHTGRLYLHQSFASDLEFRSASFDLQFLSPGVYSVHITDHKGRCAVRKLVHY